jgi:hypothetical protein
MSKQTFAGLTLDQLNEAGAAAGSDALKSAHQAGLASPGMTKLRLASGEEIKVLTRLHPDGTLEIADHRIVLVSEIHTEIGQIFALPDVNERHSKAERA